MDEFNMDYESFRKITNDGNDPEVALNRGKFAEKHKDYIGAIEDYSNAISYKEDFAEAYIRRAACYNILKQYLKAIDDYIIVEKYVKTKDSIKYMIGKNYLSIDNPKEALKYFDEAIVLKFDQPDYYYYRSLAKIKLNQNESAFFDLTKCLELFPNVDETLNQRISVLEQRAIVRASMKDFQGALSDRNQIIELFPNEGMPYYNRGVTYFTMNELAKALEDFKKASSLGEPLADKALEQILKSS